MNVIELENITKTFGKGRKAVTAVEEFNLTVKAREGFDLAITPDGPRGPAGSVERGIFFLEEKSGSPIVPLGVAARPSKRLASWDRFLVPLPFSRVVVAFGAPIEPAPEHLLDDGPAALAEELSRLSAKAEGLLEAPSPAR